MRHDRGSQYLSDDFQAELAFLGIASSPTFVQAPGGNGCAERFIRTLKENLLWVRTFQTPEQLQEALREFKRQYNEGWILERLGDRTPAQARQDTCQPQEAAARLPVVECPRSPGRYNRQQWQPPESQCFTRQE